MSQPAFDLASVRQTLRHMLDRGLITLKCLDDPSPIFKENMHVSWITFPNGYRGVRHQNLLRPEQTTSPADF
jgi:hypothetical protein